MTIEDENPAGLETDFQGGSIRCPFFRGKHALQKFSVPKYAFMRINEFNLLC